MFCFVCSRQPLDREDDERSSTESDRSSDDWSTISEELSEETRNGRPDDDTRERPVDLGPLEGPVDIAKSYQDLTSDGGVLKRLVREGDGPCPGKGFRIAMKYAFFSRLLLPSFFG